MSNKRVQRDSPVEDEPTAVASHLGTTSNEDGVSATDLLRTVVERQAEIITQQQQTIGLLASMQQRLLEELAFIRERVAPSTGGGGAGAAPGAGATSTAGTRGAGSGNEHSALTQNVSEIKPGDWYCAQCANLNFARRNECNRCHAMRPGAANAAAAAMWGAMPMQMMGMGGMGTMGGMAGMTGMSGMGSMSGMQPMSSMTTASKPGDWMCSRCGMHNFAKRTECVQCSAPKM